MQIFFHGRAKPSRRSLFASPLIRELSLILVLKLSLLYGIWWAFFSEPPPEPSAASVSRAFVGH